ncbi:hypothetical protein VNO80_00106 [Phaseolus coccineus]|uniref:Transmembrane protein n=1 Tax=Phaseolus coccineus TaxID=3886 RepID=A0AAN9RQ71_PHACN
MDKVMRIPPPLIPYLPFSPRVFRCLLRTELRLRATSPSTTLFFSHSLPGFQLHLQLPRYSLLSFLSLQNLSAILVHSFHNRLSFCCSFPLCKPSVKKNLWILLFSAVRSSFVACYIPFAFSDVRSSLLTCY